MTSPLAPDACPLLCKHVPERVADLIETYNTVQAGLELCRQYSPESEQLSSLAVELGRVRGILCRQRYRVGLMGPFQVGKSSAFNRIIGATTQSDRVAREGGGSATTATITRLYPQQQGEPALYVHYITEEQFQHKLTHLKKVTNLTDVQSLEELERRAYAKYQAYERGERERIEGAHGIYFVEAIDLKYLKLLLASYRAHRTCIVHDNERTPQAANGVSAGFAQRDKFLNHPEGFIESRYGWNSISATLPPIIARADIHFPNEVLPQDVVIVDTPGLGSMGRIDEWLFDQSVEDLDAAIIVPDASKPMDESIQKIFQRLYAAKGHFAERTWVLASKVDTISPVFSSHTSEGFNLYREMAEANRFDISRISFFTSFPEKLDRTYGDEVLRHLRAMGLEGLSDAWQAALEDGGVSRMRHIIQHDLAKSIGKRLADESTHALSKLRRSLGQLLYQVIDDAKAIDPHLERRMRDVGGVLRAEAVRVLSAPEWFRNDVVEMIQQLREAITLTPEHLEMAHLDSEFEHHSEALEAAFRRYLRSQLIRQAYNDVQGRVLEPLESEGPIAIPVDAPDGLVAIWGELRDEDVQLIANMTDHLPSFIRNSPFEGWDPYHTNPYTVGDYIALLHAKIQCVGEQTAQLLRARLSTHLEWLSRIVHRQLTRQRSGIDSEQAREVESHAARLGFRRSGGR